MRFGVFCYAASVVVTALVLPASRLSTVQGALEAVAAVTLLSLSLAGFLFNAGIRLGRAKAEYLRLAQGSEIRREPADVGPVASTVLMLAFYLAAVAMVAAT